MHVCSSRNINVQRMYNENFNKIQGAEVCLQGGTKSP